MGGPPSFQGQPYPPTPPWERPAPPQGWPASAPGWPAVAPHPTAAWAPPPPRPWSRGKAFLVVGGLTALLAPLVGAVGGLLVTALLSTATAVADGVRAGAGLLALGGVFAAVGGLVLAAALSPLVGLAAGLAASASLGRMAPGRAAAICACASGVTTLALGGLAIGGVGPEGPAIAAVPALLMALATLLVALPASRRATRAAARAEAAQRVLASLPPPSAAR